MEIQTKTDQPAWQALVNGLPFTKLQLSAEIAHVLETKGYLHLKWPMSIKHYEQLAGELGTIILRSDVRVDANQEKAQEAVRVIKGRPGIYKPSALDMHTDPNADLVSWYCVEQEEIGGNMLMIDAGDFERQFSLDEMAVLEKIELLSPGRASDGIEIINRRPLLTKEKGRYRLFYVSWLLPDSYDHTINKIFEKFVAYLKHKEETQLIELPVKKQETVFIDNRRMLHGRGALKEDSRRHLVRLYLRIAA
jgi:hypothetical protein